MRPSEIIWEVEDWVGHFRVRPCGCMACKAEGVEHYDHPGMWLTRGDYSEHRLVYWVMRFDVNVIAPVMCRLGKHRWISTGSSLDPEAEWTTKCWYCRTPHPDTKE